MVSKNSSQPDLPEELPREPIDSVVEPLTRFIHVASAGGVVLLLCTMIALALANSPWATGFLEFWKTQVGFTFGAFEFRHSLQHWINDGLMAIFFFVIGLEVKREMVLGDLREFRRAVLPILAALGGMVAPAVIYLAIMHGQAGQRGWGVPMATDIAFVVGCMAILGSRVPRGLRVMLLSLAITDDIGAILVIAIGYTEDLRLDWLAAAGGAILLVWLMARLGIRAFAAYVVVGVAIWFAFHESGVHATIAGVILGLMTPARIYLSEGFFGDVLERARDVFQGDGWSDVSHRTEKLRNFQRLARETVSPLEYLETMLHPWVGFLIMPVFALANAGVPFDASALGDRISFAVIMGLVVGKTLGVLSFSWLAVKLGWAELPDNVGWGALTGGACLAGIGFTMALFIAGLAFKDPANLDVAKIGVLVGSAVSAVLGMVLLFLFLPAGRDAAESD